MVAHVLPAGAECSLAAVRACRLARDVHTGQTDRYDEPVLEHVARVASRVSTDARPLALVHDVCERSGLSPVDVAFRVGLSDAERVALQLMTRRPDEDVVAHTRRVLAAPPGRGRDLAIEVKRADVCDHADRAPFGTPSPHARAALALDAAAP
jgi:hypothetical protein